MKNVMNNWTVDPTRPMNKQLNQKRTTLYIIGNNGAAVHGNDSRGESQTETKKSSPRKHPPEITDKNSNQREDSAENTHDNQRLDVIMKNSYSQSSFPTSWKSKHR